MTKILASIKDVYEAELISKFNFDIIDLKNVNDGALGYVGDKSVEKITKIFRNHKISVTAGNDSSPLTKKQLRRVNFLDVFKTLKRKIENLQNLDAPFLGLAREQRKQVV